MNVNMAERRRRKCTDAGSDESGDETVIHEHSDVSDGANSEYESVDEDELGEEEEEEEAVPGTGEEPEKPLDDDEDRKNPQYIPKRGTFYEHDDRTAEEAEEKSPRDEKETEKSTPQDKKPDPKKKVWKDDDSKWNHDRFIDYDQSPKTREELVATYGYDIRNEEGPPRARRRRRYGRGPNKYTRNWEDYDAYSRPSRGSSGGVSPNPRGGERGRGRGKRHSLNSEEEFPSLVPNNTQKDLHNVEDEETYVNDIPSLEITLSDRPNQKISYDSQIVSNNSKIKNTQNSPRPISDDENKRYANDKNRRYTNDENRRHGNDDNRRHTSDDNRRHASDDARRHASDDNRRYGNDENRRYGNDENRRYGNDENRRYGNDENRRQGNDENRKESVGRGRAISRRGGRAGPRGGGFGQQPRDNSNTGGQVIPWNDHIKGGRFDNKGRGQNFNRAGHSNNQIPTAVFHQQQKEIVDVADELKTMTITPSNKEEHHYSNSKRGTDTRKATLPPRLQETMRGNKSPIHGDINATSSKPKRYSSQRQRTVQDQVMYQQGYYEPNPNEVGFQSNLYEQRNNASPITNAHPVSIPPTQLASLRPMNAPPSFVAPSFASSPVYPQEPFLGRPTAPRITAIVTQPHLIGPGGPLSAGPPPVAGPAMPVASVAPVTGPHFLPPENMINFAAGAPPGLVTGPHPPQFPAAAFQAFTPVSQQQPQEIYSNGTMYYNTQSQQHIPRINPVLQKRPKAAIPILPPPDRQSMQRDGDGDYEDNYENYPENSNQDYEPRLNDNYQENYSEEYESRLNESYPDNSNGEYDDSQVNKNYNEDSSGEYEQQINEENYAEDDSGGEYEPQEEKDFPEDPTESYVPPIDETIPQEVDSYRPETATECVTSSKESTESTTNFQLQEVTNTDNNHVLCEVEEPVPVAKDNITELPESNVVLISENKVNTTESETNFRLGECPDSVQEEFIDASEEAHQGEVDRVITSEISESDDSFSKKLDLPDDTEGCTKNNIEQLESSNLSNTKIIDNPESLKEKTVEETSQSPTTTDLSSNDDKNSLTNIKENIDSTPT